MSRKRSGKKSLRPPVVTELDRTKAEGARICHNLGVYEKTIAPEMVELLVRLWDGDISTRGFLQIPLDDIHKTSIIAGRVSEIFHKPCRMHIRKGFFYAGGVEALRFTNCELTGFCTYGGRIHLVDTAGAHWTVSGRQIAFLRAPALTILPHNLKSWGNAGVHYLLSRSTGSCGVGSIENTAGSSVDTELLKKVRRANLSPSSRQLRKIEKERGTDIDTSFSVEIKHSVGD